MERSAEELGEILPGLAIHPPKLEDAGLEDCALPPESIMEAFSRAANSLTSRVFNPRSDYENDGDCVQDPGPTNGQIPDALVGAAATTPRPAAVTFRAGETKGLKETRLWLWALEIGRPHQRPIGFWFWGEMRREERTAAAHLLKGRKRLKLKLKETMIMMVAMMIRRQYLLKLLSDLENMSSL